MAQAIKTQSNTTIASTNARPFLKWVGGKTQLLAQFESYWPTSFYRYIEPFIGGGAAYFYLWSTGRIPAGAALFDNNEELINAYTVVRDQVDELILLLAEHRRRHSKDYYYQIRAQDRSPDFNLTPVERAARTLYLNKTCFNGLYRVNSKGQFNVPMGRYANPRILDEGRLQDDSQALQNALLEVRDFRTIVDLAQPGDFFYFDPPYHPLSETSSFTGYTSGNFGPNDQQDLAELFSQLDDMGCLCMLSNSHTPFVMDLYGDYRIELVQATRNVNSDANGRGKINEVVVLNY